MGSMAQNSLLARGHPRSVRGGVLKVGGDTRGDGGSDHVAGGGANGGMLTANGAGDQPMAKLGLWDLACSNTALAALRCRRKRQGLWAC